MSNRSHYLSPRGIRNLESSGDPIFVRTNNRSNFSGNLSTNLSYNQFARNYAPVSSSESYQSPNRQRTRAIEILRPSLGGENGLINSSPVLTKLSITEVIDNLKKNVSLSRLKHLRTVLEADDLNLREQVLLNSPDIEDILQYSILHSNSVSIIEEAFFCLIRFGILAALIRQDYFKSFLTSISFAPNTIIYCRYCDALRLILETICISHQRDIHVAMVLEDKQFENIRYHVPFLLHKLQSQLEIVEHVQQMESLISCILVLARRFTEQFAVFFKDWVDILIGWLVDISHYPKVQSFISDSLKIVEKQWMVETEFGLELLSQFCEDIEGYHMELVKSIDTLRSTIYLETRIIARLYAFSTIYSCLSTNDPDIQPVHSPQAISPILLRLLSLSFDFVSLLKVLPTLNSTYTCIILSTNCLSPVIIEKLTVLIFLQFSFIGSCEETMLSAFKLLSVILGLASHFSSDLKDKFYEFISKDPLLCSIRSRSKSIITEQLIELYHTIFKDNSHSLIQTTIYILLEELEENMSYISTFSYKNYIPSTSPKHLLSSNVHTSNEFAVNYGLCEGSDLNFSDSDKKYSINCAISSDQQVLKEKVNSACFSCYVLSIFASQSDIVFIQGFKRIFFFFFEFMNNISFTFAYNYPSLHYSAFHTLFTISLRFEHFVPTSPPPNLNSVPASIPGFCSENISTFPKPYSSLCEIMSVFQHLLKNYSHNSEINQLLVNWFLAILDHHSAPSTLASLQCKDSLNKTTQFLLTLTYSRDQSIRLDISKVFRKLIQEDLLTDATLRCSVPEFVFRLCDSIGEIRASYSGLLEIIPTYVLVTFTSQNFPTFGNGISLLAAQYTTLASSAQLSWMIRRRFLSQPDNSSFLPEHFKAVMAFILQGITPNRQSSEEWLGKMFKSCFIQHSSHLTRYEKMLISNTASNCDALLWYWAVFECAHFCIHNKLQTFLGDPNKTFLTVESVLRNYLLDFEQRTASDDQSAQTAFVYSGSKCSGLGPRHYTIYLRGVLLLQFLEHLEKLVHNSYFGSIILSSPCKNSQIFFRKNISTCQEWFSRIHSPIMKMAILSGLPAMAVRCGFLQFQSSQDENIMCDILFIAEALIMLKSYLILEGLGVSHGLNCATWFQGTIFEARGSYENALRNYRIVVCGSAHKHNSTNSTVTDTNVHLFCIKRLVQCYFSLGNFEELNLYYSFDENVLTYPNLSHFSSHNSELSIHLKQITALSEFYESSLNAPYLDLTESFFDLEEPLLLWTYNQHLYYSQTLLIRGMQPKYNSSCISTFEFDLEWSPDECDFTPSTFGPHRPDRSNISKWRRWLKQASAYAEAPLRVCALEWPIIVMPYHGLQLQVIAAVRAAHPEKFRLSQPVGSALNTLGLYCMKLDPFQHDLAIWVHILMLSKNIPNFDALSINNIQISIARLARKQRNIEFAEVCMRNLVSKTLSIPSNSCFIDTCNALHRELASFRSSLVLQEFNLPLYYECSKLLYCKNEKLTACQIIISSYANYLIIFDSLTLVSREYVTKMLCTLGKWFEADVSLFNLVSHNTSEGPGLSSILFVGNLLSQELTWQDCITGLLQRVASELYSSGLAKAWLNFAKWNYAVGDKLHNNISSMIIHSAILSSEEDSILYILPVDLPKEERFNVISICSKMISEIIRGDNILELGEKKFSIHISNTVFIIEKLCLRFPSLKEHPCPLKLIDVLDDILKRIFSPFDKSVQAYFTFLSKSLEQNMETDSILATLRLLRLTGKYFVEMKHCFNVGYSSTPPAVWKRIIPQVISLLDHQINGVRQILTSLLRRIAEFWPNLLLYQAILSNPISKTTTKIYEIESSKNNSTTCCLSNVLEYISQRSGTMVSNTRCLINEFLRITLLWDELWFACLSSIHSDFLKILFQFEFELRKLSTNNLSEKFIVKLRALKYQILMSPILHIFENLVEITTKSPETPFEQTFQNTHNLFIRENIYELREPNELHNDSKIRDAFKVLLDLFVSLHQKQSLHQELDVITLSPALSSIIPEVVFLPGITTIDDKPITFTNVCSEIYVQPTKTRPKKIGFNGSDGRHHNFLFKGLEDLHLDQTIMQMLSIINRIFSESHSHQRGLFQARHYGVTPLGTCSGIIEWVNNATPIFTIYKRWQLNANKSQAFDPTDSIDIADKCCQDTIPPIKPKEIFYRKLNSYLECRGISTGSCCESMRKCWPKDILREVFLELQSETPSNLIGSELWCASSCAGEWWVIQQCFCRSLAVMSIIGYIIGLGDRHLDNMLLDLATGEIIHVDYNVCFENGQKLRVPEMVPFRLTQNFRRALGPSNIEGTFRSSCENVLITLMKEEELILFLLQTIEYYPLTGFTDATTIDQSHILDRFFVDRRLEPSVDDQSVLSMSIVDNWQDWKNIFYQSIRDLVIVNNHLIDLQTNSSDLLLLDESITICKKQQVVLSEIQSNTFDNIIYTIAELNSIREELNNSLSNLQSKIRLFMPKDYTAQSCEQSFRTKFISSIGSVFKHFLISDIPEDISQLLLNDFDSSHQQNLVMEYSASHSQLINVYKCSTSIIQEILSIFDEESNISRLNVGRSCPKWIQYLDTFIFDPTLVNCNQVISALNICFAQFCMTRDYVTASLSQLLQSLCNQEDNLQSLQERLDHLSITESYNETENINHTYQRIYKWIYHNNHVHSRIILYLIGTSLPEKFAKWYSMELIAKNSGDKLCELMSEEGDWFLEELCTMSGNVYQMLRCARIGLYNLKCPRFSAVNNAINSLKLVNKIFCFMREIYHDFQRDFMDLLIIIQQSDDIQQILFHLDEIIGNYDLSSLIAESSKVYRDVLGSTVTVENSKIHSNALNIFDRIVTSLNTRDINQNSPTCKLISLIFHNYIGLMNLIQQYDYTSWKGNALSLTFALQEFQQSQLLETFVHPSKRQILADLLLFKYIQIVYEILNTGIDMLTILTDQSSNFPLPFFSESNILRPLRHFLADFLVLKLIGSPTQALLSISLNIMEILEVLPSVNIGDSLDDIVKHGMGLFFQNQLSEVNFTYINKLLTSYDIAWRKRDMKNRLETNINITKYELIRIKDYIDSYRFNYVFFLDESPINSKIINWSNKLATFNLPNLSLTWEQIIEKLHFIDAKVILELKMNSELSNIHESIQTEILKRNIFITEFRYLMDQICKLYSETLRFNKFQLNSEEISSFGKSITQDLVDVEVIINKLNQLENCNSKSHRSLYKLDLQSINNPNIFDLKLYLDKEELRLFRSSSFLAKQISKLHLTISEAFIPLSKLSNVLTRLFSLVHANIINITRLSSTDTWSRIIFYYHHAINMLDSISMLSLNHSEINQIIVNVDLLKCILNWAIGFLLYFSTNHLRIDSYLWFNSEYPVTQNSMHIDFLGYKVKKLLHISFLQCNVMNTSSSCINIQRKKDFGSHVCERVHLKIQGLEGDSSINHSVTNQVNVLIEEAVNVENLSQMYEGWTSWV